MLRKYPLVGYVVSFVVMGLYVGLLYLVTINLTNLGNFSLFGSATSTGGYTVQSDIISLTNNGNTRVSAYSAANTGLYSISCPTSTHCFATTRDGLLVTSDGGKNWGSRKAEGLERYNTLNRLSCPDTNTCYAMTESYAGEDIYSTVYLTTNGGGSWTSLNQDLPEEFFTNLACPTKDICYLVGKDGSIAATTNAGKTWKKQTSGVNQSLLGLHCPAAEVCYVVGASGTILTTKDGGTSWSKHNTDYNKSFNAVSCSSLTSCMVVGGTQGRGKTVTTSDGGQTWKSVGNDASQNQTAVSCTKEGKCYTAQADGTVRVTNDNGASWQTSTPGKASQVNSLSCVNSDKCFLLTTTYPSNYNNNFNYLNYLN